MDDSPTTLWKLGRNGESAACQVRLVVHGIEVDLVHEGRVILTRAFETGDEAYAWAATKLDAREAQGWERLQPDASEGSSQLA